MLNFYSDVIVTNCNISHNNASWYGGGIINYESKAMMSNCNFSYNVAGGYDGGGMSNWYSSVNVINSVFFCNRTSFLCFGGGMDNYVGNFNVANCTFYFNNATEGNAISIIGCSYTVTNCILWKGFNDPSNADMISGYGIGTITYSDIDCTPCSYNPDIIIPLPAGEGNMSVDPKFCQVYTFNYLPIASDSPCIDAGNSSAVPKDVTDLDSDGDVEEQLPYDFFGNPRIQGSSVDMGAYEYVDNPNSPDLSAIPSTLNKFVGEALTRAEIDLATDPDGDTLMYSYGFKDGWKQFPTSKSYYYPPYPFCVSYLPYTFNHDEIGVHKLFIYVSDGVHQVSKQITITVAEAPVPQITAIQGSPVVAFGGYFTINGSNFGSQAGSLVLPEGVRAHLTSWTNTAIAVQVTNSTVPGEIPVNITTKLGKTCAQPATVTINTSDPYLNKATFLDGRAVTQTLPAMWGDTIRLSGAFLGALQGDSKVIFCDNKEAAVLSWSDTSIDVIVPQGSFSGRVTVAMPYKDSLCTLKVNIGNLPYLTGVSYYGSAPNTALPGEDIGITGLYLGAQKGNQRVIFNGGVEANNIVLWSPSSIRVTVPQGALAGPVKIVTDHGESNGYVVNIGPTLTKATFISNGKTISLNPPAMWGSTIRLIGAHFGSSQGSSRVIFPEDREGTVVSWSDTSIDVIVPQGSCSGYMKITTPNGDTNTLKIYIGNLPYLTGILYYHGTYPDRAVPGEYIIISGWYLGEQKGSSRVIFSGGVEATNVIQWSIRSVMVAVPQGALAGPVKIVTDHGESNAITVNIVN